MNIRPANGSTGYLIRTGDTVVFRVYDKNHDFVDYDILHYDMRVQIQEDDAHFYENDGETWIDHSPETLGFKK